MQKHYRLYYLLIFILISGCIPETTDMSAFSNKIVVEGWMENGNVAHVLVSQNRPIISDIDSTTIDDIIIRWAKVSVSDGNITEVLTGHVDKNYFPPFIYKGSLMLGEVGKTYTLKIEYSGRVWTAETYIPEPVALEKIVALKTVPQDTLFTINATLKDPSDFKNYYKFFTKAADANKRYLPALMGNLDDNLFPGQERIVPVNRGFEHIYLKNFEPKFNVNDSVYVKFTTLPKHGFNFWAGYENELINGQNPFFPANKNQVSNIENGLGIWCGYGCSIYLITPGDVKQ